jgi:ribosomal protein L37AE/L43A
VIAASVLVGPVGEQTVCAVLEDSTVTDLISWVEEPEVTESRVLAIIGDRRPNPFMVFLPSGSFLLDSLQLAGLHVQPFNPNEPTNLRDRSGKLQFQNKRSCSWWLLKDRVDPKSSNPIALPKNDALKLDILSVRWKLVPKTGRVLMETPENIYKRTGRVLQYGEVVASLMLVASDFSVVYHVVECSRCGTRSQITDTKTGVGCCRACGMEISEEVYTEENPWLKSLAGLKNPWLP